MKSFTRIILILLTLSFSACNKVEQGFSEGAFYIIHARKVNYVWADNLQIEILTVNNFSGPKISVLKNNSSVKLSDYLLEFNTCNVNVTEFEKFYHNIFLSDYYNPVDGSLYKYLSSDPLNTMEDEHDVAIDNLIKQLIDTKKSKKSNSSAPKMFPVNIDYRTTPLTNIKITCSKDILGVKAGDSLNDFFEVYCYNEPFTFIISQNKELVSGKTIEIPLSQYLSYSPLAPSGINLSVKKGASITAPITAEFNVELELEGGRTISATAKPVTLIP